jgi:hypothetical protein
MVRDIRLSIFALTLLACSREAAPEAPRASTGEILSSGQSVTVGTSSGQVGLWVHYPNRCEEDVTYNWVPSGTRAIVEELCATSSGVWFARLAFTDSVVAAHQIVSRNTWLPTTELSVAR